MIYIVDCWRFWKHAPHWQIGIDPGYDQLHVLCLCRGGYRKQDVTLCR